MKTTNKFRHTYISFLLTLGTAVSLCGCGSDDTLFVRKTSSSTGINFSNTIVENDSINPLDLEFLYNGGGVAAADFNNDGKCDLYFTASTQSNKLYLNNGGFKFNDVTEQAHVTGEGRWANAASVVDINNDGWSDIYVCNTIKSDPLQRRNLLYINQGANQQGVPVFREMAEEYGLADTSYSVHAAFFDYDNDGDLDMYLLTTKLAKREGARLVNSKNDIDKRDVDKLFRNDEDSALGHPVFTDVSAAAGITHTGFGLGVAVVDINKDGWKDVYVTNDFYGSDLMYINNKNGTFSERLVTMFKHTSQNAMGNDIADINNDGLADVIAVDMNPEDNFRKKKNMNASNYNVYQNMIEQGYSIQYVRNTLQLNLGPSANDGDSIGDPVFSDISFYSGVAETDWSWNPSLVDLDNDGWRDIIITNGYPRDVTDHDFVAFRGELGNIASKDQLLEMIPQIKTRNYAFRNNGDLKFSNVSVRWGFKEPSFSNGAVYVDLDNDGDLDYVINNINEEAFVYENTLNDKPDSDNAHYLSIRYKGPQSNLFGLGTVAEIYYANGGYQVHENFPYRGYLSTVEPVSYFGLGKTKVVDSVVISWPDRRVEVIRNVRADNHLSVNYSNSSLNPRATPKREERIFREVTNSAGINYIHHESDFIDFNEQRLLLHKLSQYGPGIAAGDLDGNNLDDIFIGGTVNFPGKFFLQQADGTFRSRELPSMKTMAGLDPENMGILFFDADNDNDLDVYLASGSNEFPDGSEHYTDRLLINDGKGNIRFDTAALPANLNSKSCVKGEDYDNDGDIDLFIGGRVKPGKYPQPVSSFIYRNDTENGKVKFTDASKSIAPDLTDIGMTCDALWTDFDNDGWADLILAGEWMPVTFLKNNHGRFSNVTQSTGIADKTGWWNGVAGGDFDGDGDIDYVLGNLGTNSYLRSSDKYPVTLYVNDFDNNGYADIVPTLYLPDEQGRKREFPVHTRDDVMEQLPGLKKKFLTYKDFANADIKKIFGDKLDSSRKLQVNYLQSAFVRNDGQGKFSLRPLPALFQLAPLYGIVVEDVNEDGWLDIAATGNDFGNEVANGRYDALNGIVALGDGTGNFKPLSITESGLFIPGDGKALVKLIAAGGNYMLAGSQNRGPLKLFKNEREGKSIPVNGNDRYLLFELSGKRKRKEELYYGNSFLSQSSRYIWISNVVQSVTAVNAKGQKRTVFQR